MKKTLRYAAYHFVNKDNERFIYDIRPFLKAYYEYGDWQLKSSFEKHGEKIYLLPAEDAVLERNKNYIPSLYYFVKTKDQEIIRKIDKEELTVSDIKEKLEADESIGFAAYVYFTEKLVCFVPTLYAPTLNELHTYLIDLLKKLGIKLDIHITIMAEQTSIHEAKNMSFIGRSTIEIGSENKLFQGVIDTVANAFGGAKSNLDTSVLGGIEIIFKPARRGSNLKDVVEPLFENSELKDVQKFNLRAKEELSDRLSDYYLMTEGALQDLIDLRDKTASTIAGTIADVLNENEQLSNKLTEWEGEGRKVSKDSCELCAYLSSDSWGSDSL